MSIIRAQVAKVKAWRQAPCSVTLCQSDQHHGESMELIQGLKKQTHDLRAVHQIKNLAVKMCVN